MCFAGKIINYSCQSTLAATRARGWTIMIGEVMPRESTLATTIGPLFCFHEPDIFNRLSVDENQNPIQFVTVDCTIESALKYNTSWVFLSSNKKWLLGTDNKDSYYEPIILVSIICWLANDENTNVIIFKSMSNFTSQIWLWVDAAAYT